MIHFTEGKVDWQGAEETWVAREVAREALFRSIRWDLTTDLNEASALLGIALHKSLLRNHPAGLKVISEHFGVEAFTRGHRYCEETHFPKGPLPTPRNGPGDQRKTPAEVRALWGICREAVEEVFTGLTLETSKAITLGLSWGLHKAAYIMGKAYREEVDELRRIRQTRRLACVVAMPILLAQLLGA